MTDRPVAAAPSTTRRKLLLLARVAVAVALLAFLTSRIDTDAALRVAAGIRPDWVLLLLLASLGERVYGAWRWHRIIRQRHDQVGFRSVLRLTFTSAFIGIFLPGAAGTYAMRAYGLARLTADTGGSIASLLADRLLVTIAMLAMALAGLLLHPELAPAGAATTLTSLTAAGLLASLVALHPAVAGFAERRLRWRWVAPLRKLAAAYALLAGAIVRYPGSLALSFALAAGLQVIRVLVVASAMLALGLQVPFAVLLFIVPVTMFALMVPISFAGLGVREAAFIVLLRQIGVPPEAAFTASLLVYVTAVATTLPGAVLLMLGTSASPQARPRQLHAPRNVH